MNTGDSYLNVIARFFNIISSQYKMKPYGIKPADWGCCASHDKYDSQSKITGRARKKVRDRARKKKERQKGKKEVMNPLWS